MRLLGRIHYIIPNEIQCVIKPIVFGLIVICVLTAFSISVNAQSTPDVKIIVASEIFHYGESLDYTIIVSDVTGEDATIYITDSTGIRSKLYVTPISAEETHIIAPIGFDSIIWNEGKYLLELEYSGSSHEANFMIVDDGSVGIPYWINDLAKLWLTTQIPDKEYAKGIQYLIEHDILIQNIETGDELYIPEWFKFTTAWWASGQITDTNYNHAMQFLIDQKFMMIPFDQELDSSTESFL